MYYGICPTHIKASGFAAVCLLTLFSSLQAVVRYSVTFRNRLVIESPPLILPCASWVLRIGIAAALTSSRSLQ